MAGEETLNEFLKWEKKAPKSSKNSNNNNDSVSNHDNIYPIRFRKMIYREKMENVQLFEDYGKRMDILDYRSFGEDTQHMQNFENVEIVVLFNRKMYNSYVAYRQINNLPLV